jgi:hypothetical protein
MLQRLATAEMATHRECVGKWATNAYMSLLQRMPPLLYACSSCSDVMEQNQHMQRMGNFQCREVENMLPQGGTLDI